MENTPPQEQEHHQEQHLGGQDHPSQPVLPPPAEANSGSERTKKRPRASTSAVCDSADEDHDAKRRQTSDAHDGVAVADTTGNATASTAKNRIATRITFANETAATIAEHINEAAEYASKEGRGAAAEAMQHSTEFQPHILQMENVPDVAAVAAVAAAAAAAAAEDEEERSTIEASGGSTSTSDFVSTEASTLDASSDNSSIHQSSPRSASHGSAALEAENQVNGSYTTHFESFAEWQAFLDGDREKPYPYWASQPNSDCYALTWSTLPKEHKSVPYRDSSWLHDFNRCGTYMSEDSEGLGAEATALYKDLLEREQPLPKKSLFDDDIIGETCERIRFKNETTLFRDITPLIAPSVELLAIDDLRLGLMCESTNEVWSNSQPVIRIQPQPSYAIGFSAEAFTEEQFGKAKDFFDDLYAAEISPTMKVTPDMFFPCFAVEIGPIALGERQNAHSMTIGMRGVIELFRGAGREAELDRQILGWSIAHDHHRVEISVHYPVIYGDIANFHRKKIRSFDFNDPKCDRWTAYRFTRNLYGTWMLAHFARVCSAIDDLPNKWPRYVDSIDGFQS
ncbi:hypothetical protein HDV57DRAFT_493347 [Trichoderma longibrachiatum]